MNRFFAIRNTSRTICATTALLALGAIAGLSVAAPAQARAAATSTLTSLSAPTQFTAGANIALEVGISGGAAQVHVTSLPAGIVDYTATATGSSALTVPTNAISGAKPGDKVQVTLVVTLGSQSLSTDTTANASEFEPIFPAPSQRSEFEPIFPAPTATTKSEFEPIFPAPTTKSEFEPIFPAPTATPKSEFEPIFPAPPASPKGEFEPIFPAPAASPKGEFEPIFPRALASRFHRLETVRILFAHH